jgi:hypothetical protein
MHFARLLLSKNCRRERREHTSAYDSHANDNPLGTHATAANETTGLVARNDLIVSLSDITDVGKDWKSCVWDAVLHRCSIFLHEAVDTSRGRVERVERLDRVQRGTEDHWRMDAT